MKKYNAIIGLEIHAELKTQSKMFCSCANESNVKNPNINVCPICLGHPGTLPQPNKLAIEQIILVGLAVNGNISRLSKFDRKNYFYPDLPKGYQISQYDLPLVHDGYLDVSEGRVAITRIHLEEDTAKSIHPKNANYTLLDFNRAGAPLLEMVTEPIIKNAAMAKKFCQAFQQILRYLKISDADMEKGQMRCEANISVQEEGKWKYEGDCKIIPLKDYKLNPKTEVKNINSFKSVEKAIDYEIKRQIEALEKGELLVQETRGWDENKNITVRQRIKESSADYRYFPEPDIPPLIIQDDWISDINSRLIELPYAKKERFMLQYNLNPEVADVLVMDKMIADWTEEVISELRAWILANNDTWERQNQKLSKMAADWITGELFKHLNSNNQNIREAKITAENFAELIALIFGEKINSSAGQKILEVMYQEGGDPEKIMERLGLRQLDDTTELARAVEKIITENPDQVTEYKKGKTNVIQFLIGKTMAATGGKANPKIVAEILREKMI
jgi:aspartyl-tRNA(Asn)/glutamyl-tRNA(Gln) amidotransferase subunit B